MLAAMGRPPPLRRGHTPPNPPYGEKPCSQAVSGADACPSTAELGTLCRTRDFDRAMGKSESGLHKVAKADAFAAGAAGIGAV